ncbi:MAG: UPF0182 family protein [Dehalococcoidia bacterium]|nr:UPF0182 family protein [Dehalococcoidia bacterium]MSQ16225.1 UPF0182 family protein [Dehalococcoidia bacterium]
MSYNLPSDAGAPTGPGYPGISAPALRRIRAATLALAALVAVFLLLWWLANAYTDWLWFGHLGFRGVFVRLSLLRLGLFAGGALAAAAVLILNLLLVVRLSRGESSLSLPEDTARLLRAGLAAAAVLAVVIASLLFGQSLSGRWQTVLLFLHRVPFGVADPQFGLDVTDYAVTWVLLSQLQGWLLALTITVILASLALYAAMLNLRGLNLIVTPRMLRHLSILGLFLMLILAARHLLDVFGLVSSARGGVAGAMYTDVHARVPALLFMTGIALMAAAGFAVSRYYGGLRLMIGAFSLWVIMALLAGLAYPALYQRFRVAPSQLAREQPYILRNLEATRAAFQLDRISEAQYPALGTLTAQAVQQNRSTVENIRLWDPQPLRDVYNQLQFNQLYYTFHNVDSDRYLVDGRLQQVLVAARELDSGNLPAEARNWVNQRLQYTHGYGVAMSPATSFTAGEGRPDFLVRDIPIQGEFSVSRPQMYFGETTGYALVNSAMTEVDPDAAFRRYGGRGDVPLSSWLRRAAFAWRFGDINIMLSDQITPNTYVQYRRSVAQRVTAIAPFLKLDQDPYVVLDDAGRLWWILDTYTTTARYPYSSPAAGGFNYIRNSVKVAVDAYNGTVHFYVADGEDPLLKMYRRAFPSLFQELAQMPPDLRAHLRYPRDLFEAQAQTYLRYHVTDPQVFFNQAEQWAIPQETRFGKPGAQSPASYQVIRLPGEAKEEFILMLPFTPAGEKKNLVGWLVARNDGPHYGQLLAFRLPADRQVDGPSQVEARIENDQEVSQQFTLWEGAGSRIIRGQLLVIPIADAILYVEPLYLRSEGLAFPELKKVIIADASRLVMADTIDQGLAYLTGGAPTAAASGGPVPAGEELERMKQSVEDLRQSLERLQDALDDLRKTLGGSGLP